MTHPDFVTEEELAALAKGARVAAGVSRAQAARELGVKHPSVFHAEESPTKPYTKLRRRIIETYTTTEVTGPVFLLRQKS